MTTGATRARGLTARGRWWAGLTRTALLAVLALAGCAGPGGAAAAGPATPPTVPSPPASSSQLTVTSTLDGHAALPLRIHWQAFPGGTATDVSEIDFLIDGRLAWVEHNAPYFYGDDGNWLVTSFLKPGEHTFTVRVITADGLTAADMVQSSVTAATAPPSALNGVTWVRQVTPADVLKSTSGQAPSAGRWRLRISQMGWQLRDPAPGSNWGLFDVRYRPGGGLQMRPTIEYPPYPNSNNGGFCEKTDPVWTWTYSIGNGGKTLTLRPLGHDPCGDRIAILAGTWTRPVNEIRAQQLSARPESSCPGRRSRSSPLRAQSHSQSHSPASAAVRRLPSLTLIAGHGPSRPGPNAWAHIWKACWGQPLPSSNLASCAHL
jgi:hypothetical protein